MSRFDIDLVNRAGANPAIKEMARISLAVPKEVEEYQTKVKPGIDIAVRPVKTVVISQDPKSGETVPQGTEVTVVLASKPSLPFDLFDVDAVLTDKYAGKNVGVVIDDLTEKGPAAKAVIEQDKPYQDLAGDEKTAVKEYARQNLGFDGDDAALEKVYGDLRFITNF